MPTLRELAETGQLHRVARYVRQELSPLDFERAPEALEARIEELLRQALELTGTPVPELRIKNQESRDGSIPNDKILTAGAGSRSDGKISKQAQSSNEQNPPAPPSLRKSPSTDTRDTSEVVPSQTPASPQLLAPSSGKTAFFQWVAETMPSSQHPERNEDRWVVTGEHQLAAVLDGVGGSAAAATASGWVAERLQKEFTALRASGEQVINWPAAIKQLLIELNTQFLAAAKSQKALKGGSTTVALAKIVPASFTSQESLRATSEVSPAGLPPSLPSDNQPPSHRKSPSSADTSDEVPAGSRQLVFGVVGDSRVSIWHKTGRYELTALDDQLLRLLLTRPERRPSWLAPLSRKHGLDPTRQVNAEEAARAATRLDGDPDPSAADELTKFLFAERAIVTQVLGAPTVNPHAGVVTVHPGDRVLVASDGIHDNLTDGELIRILAHTELSEVASALVVRAHEVSQSEAARAKKDDMTAVVLEIL